MRKSALIAAAVLAAGISLHAQDAWKISVDNPRSEGYYGVSVSNGNIGLVSSAVPMQLSNVVLAGVYDLYGRGRVANFLPSFNPLAVGMVIGGTPVHPGSIEGYRQELDMLSGEFNGYFTVPGQAEVKYTFRALRQLPDVATLEVTVKALKNTRIGVSNTLATPASLKNARMSSNSLGSTLGQIPVITTVAESPTGKVSIGASVAFLFDGPYWEGPAIDHEMNDADSHRQRINKGLRAGEQFHFTLVAAIMSSRTTPDVLNQTERMVSYACLQGANNLCADHRAGWNKLWESDITIEGDAQAQQDIHNMLYHLYAFSGEGSRLSLSPMGLSGLGYNGHVFWDTELFMEPAILLMQPELARSYVDYRFDRLGAARENARMHGYKGAMYPWESAATGEEETPVWAMTGPYEHHITGDVAWSAWQYWCATQDREWLRTEGWPILRETADFWKSRVVRRNDRYEILNVVCADEWAENVDNNAYTNGVAALNLRLAAKAARILGETPDPQWEKIADEIYIGRLPDGVTREHDSYKGENIKQADVNLLSYPLGAIRDEDQVRKDLKYYQSRVPMTETPAMTKSIFALLHSRLGDGAEAAKWFKESYEPNLLPPFRVMAEEAGGSNPYFTTGAGGVLQAVVMGFAGASLQEDGSIQQLDTALPQGWKSVKVTGLGKDKVTLCNPKKQ